MGTKAIRKISGGTKVMGKSSMDLRLAIVKICCGAKVIVEILAELKALMRIFGGAAVIVKILGWN